MTLQEPHNPSIADIDMPDTEVIVLAPPSPVFVDATGRRRRMLRKVAYGFGALCMVYGGLVSVSLAGGPVSSSAVLPLPDRADDDNEEGVAVARPSPTAEPVVTRATVQPVLEAFPTQGAPVTRPREARGSTPRTSTVRLSPTPSAQPGATPTSAKPVESSTTKPPASSSTPSPAESGTPVPPAPPPVPSNGGSSGGQGGGGAADEPSDPPATRAPVEPRPPAVTKPVEPRPPAVTRPAEPDTAPAEETEPPAEPSAEPPAEPDAGDGEAP